jgi:hypothetical protein
MQLVKSKVLAAVHALLTFYEHQSDTLLDLCGCSQAGASFHPF